MTAKVPKREMTRRWVVDKIHWEGEYKMPDFVSCFTKNLPVIIKTLSGLMGCDDLHIIGGDEIYWIYDIKKQKRVVTSLNHEDQYCTIPVDHPAKFNIYQIDKNGKKKLSNQAKQLRDILQIITDSKEQNLFIECENNGKLHFQIGSDDGNQARFGLMEVVDVYDEKYLLGYPLCGKNINPSPCGIPVYLDIELTIATDFVDYPRECFNSWMLAVQNIASTFPRDFFKTCQEIIIFSQCPGDGLYEYINPTDFKFGIDKVKSGLEDYSKVDNPYILNAPPPPVPPRTIKSSKPTTAQNVELPEIPKCPPPLPPVVIKMESDIKNISGDMHQNNELPISPSPNTLKNEKNKSEKCCRVNEAGYLASYGAQNSANMPSTSPTSIPTSPPSQPPKKLERATVKLEKTSSHPQQPTSISSTADVKTFSMEEVQNCLKLLNMSNRCQLFQDKQVDGELLSCMDVDLLINEFKCSRFEALKLTKFIQGWRPTN